jgi:DNA-binding transcriptional MerR regulator/methylmalonyl-CoA mutase cobalamin-binding subunit
MARVEAESIETEGPDRSGLTISSVGSLLGIPVPTIRSWERRYGVPAPARTAGRHRRYSTSEVELLRALRDEITRGHPAREAVDMVRRARGERDFERGAHRAEFVSAAMRLDPAALRAALDGAAADVGLEAAIRDVALPAMRRIGDDWEAGTCDVANEHLATEAVRSWLARLAAMNPPPVHRAPILLACGPEDLHSIGIEAFSLLLARRGWPVRTLGSRTPAASLVTAVRATRTRAVVVSSQRSVTRRAAIESLAGASSAPGVRAFYAGDGFAAPAARRGAPGTYLGPDVVAAVGVLEATLLGGTPMPAGEPAGA